MDSKEDKLLITHQKIDNKEQILNVPQNQNHSVLSYDETDEEMKKMDALSIKKQKELIAALHSKTEALGIINHTCVTSCPCCQKTIPQAYRWNKVLLSSDLIHYGIDMINMNSIIKKLFSFVKFFWIFMAALMIISILINIKNYIDYVKLYVQGKAYNFFIIDDFLFYYVKNTWVIYVSFICYFGILVVLFLIIHKKITLNKKKHRMNFLEKKEVEETLFSVFVKNLPKLTDTEDIKNFIEKEYNVAIREIIMLNDFTVLESLRKKLEDFGETGKFSNEIMNSIKSQIDYYAANIEQSGAAILILENNEDRLLFFREFFNLREILYMYCKRDFIYRGRKIYFEPVPSVKMIDWNNVKYSLEKTTSNTKLQYVVSFLAVTLLYAITITLIFLVSTLELVKNKILNSFLKNLILLGLNMGLKISIILMIEAFKISDNYVKEVFKSHFQAQRNTNNAVFLNLLKLAVNQTEAQYDILFLIVLQNLKLAFLARYNYNFFYRFFSYKLFSRKKIFSQEKLNDLLGDNNFNFMSVFEGFKICFYLAIFVLLRSPTLAIIATFLLYLHLVIIRFSMNRSRIKGINTNYYGFYFSYILEKEFLLTGKFFLTYIVACSFNYDVAYFIGANATADLALDLLKMKTFYTKFWVKKTYSEIQFTRKFENEKFVTTKLYMDEINGLLQKLNHQLELKNNF